MSAPCVFCRADVHPDPVAPHTLTTGDPGGVSCPTTRGEVHGHITGCTACGRATPREVCRVCAIGLELLEVHGVEAIRSGYALTDADPYAVGRAALAYGDAEPDGSLT